MCTCVYLHFSPVQVFKFYKSNVQKKILHLFTCFDISDKLHSKILFPRTKTLQSVNDPVLVLTSYQTSVSHFILLQVYIYSHKTSVLRNKKKLPMMCIRVLIHALYSELYLPGHFNIYQP